MKHIKFCISTVYMCLILCILMVLRNKYIGLKCMEWTTLSLCSSEVYAQYTISRI